jgi:MFS family permease
MAFQPADKLTNRTFVGLITAQFLAGFNDQAIHAAAMFYAIHQGILSEAQAISLMPILFYSPWAIFCTAAGHFADRYSKTTSLIVWKISEVIISIVLVVGFYLGTQFGMSAGAWIVLSCVFLMGTHAAFFAPAKYGAMPEILQPHILSKGNGILESTTFLAAILGTVSGGGLAFLFHGKEYWTGWVILALSVFGAVASFMIAYLPAASPSRPFPRNPFSPIWKNLKVLLHSRPLALSVLGIAFFIFMVSYMRATMYMHGQSRNPPWDELKTSLVVASVALGVGLGSPLAGYLSGGKIELGLVPLGCVGMILAAVLSALMIDQTAGLVVALVIIGFFSGFYMVPLYTLLQHRAPKQSKGELIATSNFINVTGAIAASLLFYFLVTLAQLTNFTPVIPQNDRVVFGKVEALREDIRGRPEAIHRDLHGKPAEVGIRTEDGQLVVLRATDKEADAQAPTADKVIPFAPRLLEVLGGVLAVEDDVVVSEYTLGNVHRFRIRRADVPLSTVYDNRGLPRYLFIGAALMTLGILVLLLRKLPDFFVRTLFWMRSLGKYRIKAVNMHNLPTNGPVILATNSDRLESALEVVSVTDRSTLFVLWEKPEGRLPAPLLRSMAKGSSVVEMSKADHEGWLAAHERAKKAMRHGDLLAITLDGHADDEVQSLINDLRELAPAPIIPVYCGKLDGAGVPKPRVRVVFGVPMQDGATLDEVRSRIRELGEWIREHDDTAAAAH